MTHHASEAEQQKRSPEEILQLVSFTVGREEFGLDILRVQEINRMTEITRVPNAPPFVSGVINLRGKVIPIVDLRLRFGMNEAELNSQTRIIVVELETNVVGFIVDSVREVLRVPRKIMEPPPPMVAGIGSEYLTAVCKLEDRLLILLDLDAVLSTTERATVATIAN